MDICEHYENDGTYCYKAGDAYFDIHDYRQAKTYYEKTYNRKEFFSWGCIGLGRLHQETKNYSQAKIYSEKACKLDDGYGCGILGVIYEQGQGVIQDITLAKLYYKKSCDLYCTLN